MTKIEKQTIENALIEYVEVHKDSATGNIAEAILAYWKDIVELPTGKTTI